MKNSKKFFQLTSYSFLNKEVYFSKTTARKLDKILRCTKAEEKILPSIHLKKQKHEPWKTLNVLNFLKILFIAGSKFSIRATKF